jgi:hypothetical protein
MTENLMDPSHPVGFVLDVWRRTVVSAWAALALYAAIYVAVLIGHPPPAVAAALVLAEVLVAAVVQGAQMRLGLGPGGDTARFGGLGPAGLQWTAVETRILLSRLLLMLVVILLLVAAVFCMALAAAVTLAMSAAPSGVMPGQTPPGAEFFHTGAGAAMIVTGLSFAAATVFVLTRLALSGPATVDQGGVRVFATWPMTAGLRPWRLLVWCPVLNILVFGLGFALHSGEQTGALHGASATIASLAYALFTAFIETPMSAGVSILAYRRLKS